MSTRGARPPNGAGQAVVVGASLAGLLAARVLADHFERVTVVERDHLPPGPAFRPGVPQARHVHLLLARGLKILEVLFPGLGMELVSAGAETINWPSDVGWLSRGGWVARFRTDLSTYACSRELLEWSVRRRLEVAGRVRFLEGCDVEGLVADGAGGVAGVRARPRAGSPGAAVAPAELPADFVVDASGRSSRAPEWLAELSFPAPRETLVSSFLGYATRCYQRPPSRPNWTALVVQSRPPGMSRAGVVFPLEGDRWLVTLTGAARDYPPTDPAGFLEFAGSLRSPLLYEAIQVAEPLSSVYGYRRTENRLRHYEALARWPERFVATGDAVCAFNPVYGQGMTTCAEAARILDDCFRARRRERPGDGLAGLARQFQRELARANETPWMMATSEDFRYPTTEGGRPGPLTRLMHAYMDRVLVAAGTSPEVAKTFLEVMHLVKPPLALFRPAVARPVLAGRTAPSIGAADRIPAEC